MESSVGTRIKRLRKDLGLTQGDLAGDQLSRAMLSLIERDLTTPSLRTIEYLSYKLGVSVGDLLGEIKDASMPLTTADDIQKGLNICQTLFKVKKYSEAESRLNELVNIKSVHFPNKWLAYKLLGRIHQKMDQHESALTHFKESLSYLSSTDTNEIVEVYYYITLSNRKLDKYKEGIVAALKASALINTYHAEVDCLLEINILYNLALCYCRIKEFQKGLDVVDDAMAIMEKNDIKFSNGHFYMLKGIAELYMRKYAAGFLSTRSAIDYFDPVVDTHRYIGSRINLGILLRKQNKAVQSLEELHACLDEAEKLNFTAHAVNNYYELSLSYLYIDNIELAEHYIQLGIERSERKSHLQAQCHYALGKVLMKKTEHQSAIKEFNKSESIFNTHKNDSWLALVKSEKAICYKSLDDHQQSFDNLLESNRLLLSNDLKLISTELPIMS
ncbi:helix-turn-helix domain-containing protein [Pseudalkalibacillus berkeleyi]|uniref:Helix-turn-helix domain-containing protein n=1 Tax=Pseudalkalibacillus berkeleyi TaxID=1069813 RepID=A0ABS9GXI4_9BACL|nr:helix-turn-helix transcriptional regulator [Pseudalkalibacillus berkeleyi]MCF6136395.1 helix-turn-helix domain-containing protein [Pseudalkalibacillus berkeleyi]